jgi:thiol-disulfide isomerase/thioredoxin
VLNELNCTLNNDLTAQLESYRAMKKGNTAPDILFSADLLAPGYAHTHLPKKLSDVRSKYTVVVFGASWCQACHTELSQMVALYPKWKQQDVEVVFVSLDQNQHDFRGFSAGFPFISISDYQQWESAAVKSYHVFATPTFFLLDANRKIVLRPSSAKQIDAWVDWFLKQ